MSHEHLVRAPGGVQGRILLASNRLPVSVRRGPAGLEVVSSTGGLALGMREVHQQAGALWVGWPGDLGPPGDPHRAAVERRLADLRTVLVNLSAEEVRSYYEGYSNGVLYPLFHYRVDLVQVRGEDWGPYVSANERFADVIAAHAVRGDTIWVHDFHLMLLPALLRERLPGVRIGFFLHIPFPAPDVFAILPTRKALLEGLLGAHLIGFHTQGYLDNFAACLDRFVGPARRHSRMGVFPMGVDTRGFSALGADPAVTGASRAEPDRRIVLGVDRLDYTKGLVQRLDAFERLLDRNAAFRGRVRLVQLAVPSKEKSRGYPEHRAEVEAAVQRINARYPDAIDYRYSLVPRPELAALYRSADVMFVTPVRDGLNLVSKEYVATRVDGDGVLVLSEFAGAADELREALIVNPYEVGGLSTALESALTMPEDERRRRMAALRAHVLAHPVEDWAAGYLAALGQAADAAK